MVKIPFTFEFNNKHYAGLFQKAPAVGMEVSRFEVFDVEPPDFPVPKPFFIAGNYDDNDYSFHVAAGDNPDFLRAITKAVIAECEVQGIDRC